MKHGEALLLRSKQLEDVRRDYEEGLWDDITRFVNPRREGINSEDHTLTKGRRRGMDAYDGTPNGALGIWADGMQGFLVSENLKWFQSELGVPELDKDDNVRLWLQSYDQFE